jgi:hypothetical protein
MIGGDFFKFAEFWLREVHAPENVALAGDRLEILPH